MDVLNHVIVTVTELVAANGWLLAVREPHLGTVGGVLDGHGAVDLSIGHNGGGDKLSAFKHTLGWVTSKSFSLEDNDLLACEDETRWRVDGDH